MRACAVTSRGVAALGAAALALALASTSGLAAQTRSLSIRHTTLDPIERFTVVEAGRIVTTIEVEAVGRTIDAELVAGTNVLLSWGCGTYCTTSVLYDANGRSLGTFGLLDVSPDHSLAASYAAFDAPLEGGVEIISLRTGLVLVSRPDVPAWNTCRVEWSADRVRFQRCTRATRSFSLALPDSPR